MLYEVITAGGLAAIVMGLGLGALFLALLSGLGWFLSWNYNLQWAHDIKELHEALVRITSYNVCYTKLLRKFLQTGSENDKKAMDVSGSGFMTLIGET